MNHHSDPQTVRLAFAAAAKHVRTEYHNNLDTQRIYQFLIQLSNAI